MRADDLFTLPDDLPVPADDGAADHLTGMQIPAVALPATDGSRVDLSALEGTTVVFAYPRTGKPGEDPLGGLEAWNAIPGARGCTPQACSFRDTHELFAQRGARVFGLSTQPTEEQREAVERLHLPYPLLSDVGLELARALRLPTFEVEGVTIHKRLTFVARDGRIAAVQYPVFPPDAAATAALEMLDGH